MIRKAFNVQELLESRNVEILQFTNNTPLPGLRQSFATETPLKMKNEKCFLFHLKISFRSQDI